MVNNIGPNNNSPISFAQKMSENSGTRNILAQLTGAFEAIAKLENNTKGIGRNLNLVDTNTNSPQQRVIPAEAGSGLNQFA
jgi:hypothetical protein